MTQLWQKVTRGVTRFDRHAELTAASLHLSTCSQESEKQVKAPAPRLVGRLASAPEQPKPIDVSVGEHAGIDRASRRWLVQGTLEIGTP